MIIRIILFILLCIIMGISFYVAFKGVISDDKEREDKWAEYEHKKKRSIDNY